MQSGSPSLVLVLEIYGECFRMSLHQSPSTITNTSRRKVESDTRISPFDAEVLSERDDHYEKQESSR